MTGGSTNSRKALSSYRRVVIKIGSALLVDRKTGLKSAWLDSICSDIAALKAAGVDVLVVSSGKKRSLVVISTLPAHHNRSVEIKLQVAWLLDELLQLIDVLQLGIAVEQ